MAIQIVTFGPKDGICNMCGKFGQLTEDHTPPKGCIKLKQIDIQHIADHLSATQSKGKGAIRKFQSGVKYRTLCSHCNNHILGTMNDPIFIDFVNQIIQCLNSYRDISYGLNIRTKPQRLMRSLLGHITAQGVDRFKKGPNTEELKNYMLDETRSLPRFLTIYCWLFPYQRQVLVRDSVYMELKKSSQPVFMWLLKFFPIAFFVAWDEDPQFTNLTNLSIWRDANIDDEISVHISTHPIIHPNWPEAPTNQSVVVYGREAVASLKLKL